VHTCTLGFSALEEFRARWLAAHDEIADPDAAWLAALTGLSNSATGWQHCSTAAEEAAEHPSAARKTGPSEDDLNAVCPEFANHRGKHT
jgi:hypothetical protein